MMNVPEPTADNSGRTGNRCGTTITIFKAIGMISEEIDRIYIRIGRTCEPTCIIKEQMGRGSVVGINNGAATVDSAAIRYL